MDINVCKQAILSNSDTVADKTAFDLLAFSDSDVIATDSFSRYIKYYQRYHPKRNLDKAFLYLFENFITNNTLVESYYAKEIPQPINTLVYKLFCSYKHYGTKYISNRVQNEVLELIHNEVPELLM